MEKEKSMTIVLCSKGYPGNYKKEQEIVSLDKIKLNKKNYIYHAGTKFVNQKLFSVGGRVLNVTAVGSSFSNIRHQILKTLRKINWKGGFFRRDIGWRVIKKNENN